MLDGNMKTMKNNEQWDCSLIRIMALLELIKRNAPVYLYLYVWSSVLELGARVGLKLRSDPASLE